MPDRREGIRERLAVWGRALRYHFVPPSTLPAILGSLAAWAGGASFRPLDFALVVVCVTLNHAALNMTDDYFDYLHSVDSARMRERNPYSGGSGLLTSGKLDPRAMRRAFVALYAITVCGGAFLAATRGWPVLAFGLVGVLSSFFYTAPPLRYGYRGYGELSQLVNFSLTIGLGAYFVQAGGLTANAALTVLPLGFMMFSMITVNEIPDEENDRAGGKRTLVVRFGARVAVRLYGASMTAAYVVVAAASLAPGGTPWSALALATAPLFVRALLVLRRHYRDPAAMAPANLLTIRVHNLTGLLLIAAQAADGAARGRDPAALALAAAAVLVLVGPAAAVVFRPQPERNAEAAG